MKITKQVVALALALLLLASVFSFGSFADREGADAPNGRVRVTSNKTYVEEGDSVILTAETSGFGDLKLSYQWQVDEGNGWEDIKKAVKRNYTFTYSESTANCVWRVIVHLIEEDEEQAQDEEPVEEQAEPAADAAEQPADPNGADVQESDPQEQADVDSGNHDAGSDETSSEEPKVEPDAPSDETASEPKPSEQTTSPADAPKAEESEPIKIESQPEESKPEQKPEPKPEEPKSEPKPESKPEESKPEPKPEPKHDDIKDNDVPLSAGLDADADGEIDIFADIQNPENGDIVTLSTPLSATNDGSNLLCQWFVDRGDGRGFAPISGANGRTYSYTYSDACANYRFRVELSIPSN